MRSELAHQPASQRVCAWSERVQQQAMNVLTYVLTLATLRRLLVAAATRQPLTQLPATSQSKSFAHSYEARR